MSIFKCIFAKFDNWLHRTTLAQLEWARNHPSISNERYQKMVQQYQAVYGDDFKRQQ